MKDRKKGNYVSGKLTRSVVRGASWTGISQTAQQGFRLLTTIILARLLFPEDFGVISMVVVFTSIAVTILDMGLNQAIIQRKEVTEDHLNTTFWTILAMGVFLCVVLVAGSSLVAKFFGTERVGPVLSVASISCIICPLGAVHGALLRKRLDFFRFSMAEALAAVVYLVVGVVMAVLGFGVWSIVAAGIANDTTYVVMRWILCRWHPSFKFSFSALKDLWGFGINQTGTKFIEIVIQRLDSLIIGRFMTAAALGFYNLGIRVTTTPSQNLRFIITRVAFPAYSTIQDEGARLRRGFLKSVSFISIIGLPFFFGLVIVAPEFVRVVFGQKWGPAILPMQILSAAVAFRVIALAVPSLLLAKGRPGINLIINVARIVLMVPALLFGVKYGTVGVAVAISSVEIILWPVQQIIATRLIGLRAKEYLAALYPAVMGCVVMSLVMLGFRYAVTSLFPLTDIGLLVSTVILGAAAYIATMKLSRIESFNEMIGLVQEMVRPYWRPAMAKIGILSRED
jgi:O-antigen/teichoic acid export membrane protein